MEIMQFTLLLLLLLLEGLHAHEDHHHNHDNHHHTCGTAEPSKTYLKREKAIVDRRAKHQPKSAKKLEKPSFLKASPANDSKNSSCRQCEDIELVIHVVTDDSGATALLATDENLAKNVAHLNNQFSETPFRFVHTTTTRTVHNDWAQDSVIAGPYGQLTAVTDDMTFALRQGGPDVANIFITDGLCQSSVQGLSSMPTFRGMFPKDIYSRTDVLIFCSHALLSSESSSLLTHELGHWMGLFHTFTGESCDADNPGDLVDDTPQQRGATQLTCPDCCGTAFSGKKDSCPLREGTDDIFNFMDYSPCAIQFTPGQVERMTFQFNQHRRRILTSVCPDGDMNLHVEAQLGSDANEQQTSSFLYLEWGLEEGLVGEMLPQPQQRDDDPYVVDLTNQLVQHSFCIPRNALYEYQYPNIPSVTFTMNGRTLPSTGDAMLVAGDSQSCLPGQSRFELDLFFGDAPANVYWEIIRKNKNKNKNDDNVVVVDASATHDAAEKSYLGSFSNKWLFFDQCLDGGGDIKYDFVMHNLGPSRFEATTFKIGINGKTIGFRGPGLVDTNTMAFSTPNVVASPWFCISGSAKVLVLSKNKGRTTASPQELASVRLGDMVHVGNGVYEPIYSFGHFQPNVSRGFLRIQTNDKRTLDLSRDHMVFTVHHGAIAASRVKVGDQLVGAASSSANDAIIVVTSIEPVQAQGLFAPFTPSGKIAVDGIVTSSFVAMTTNGGLLSDQWIAHSFEFPHRVACYWLSGGRCNDETYTADGVSVWVATPHRLALQVLEAHWVLRGLFFVAFGLILVVFNLLEYFVFKSPALLSSLVVVGYYYMARKRAIGLSE